MCDGVSVVCKLYLVFFVLFFSYVTNVFVIYMYEMEPNAEKRQERVQTKELYYKYTEKIEADGNTENKDGEID